MTAQQINIKKFDIIRRPVLTEKSTNLLENNCYVFEVALTATKPDIKKAIEEIFDVSVERVNTLVRKGKTRVFRGRRGVRKDTKRAMVFIKDGKRLDLTAGV